MRSADGPQMNTKAGIKPRMKSGIKDFLRLCDEPTWITHHAMAFDLLQLISNPQIVIFWEKKHCPKHDVDKTSLSIRISWAALETEG